MFDFIAKCNNSIGKFESLVHQIQKNANDIKDRLTAMEATNLFREPEKKFDQLPSCKVSLCINCMLPSLETGYKNLITKITLSICSLCDRFMQCYFPHLVIELHE